MSENPSNLIKSLYQTILRYLRPSSMITYLQNTLNFCKENPSVPFVTAAGLIYTTYYLCSVVKKPLIACKDQKLLGFIKKHCPISTEKYWPTFWCIESRLQTILRVLLQSKPNVQYRSELIYTADGGQIKLDWAENDSNQIFNKEVRPTILLLPGLTGSSNESYILHMVTNAMNLGYRCVVFNNRGVGGSRLLTPRTYCAANTEDLTFVVNHIKVKYPQAPLMGTGVSLGGMILFNYLAKTGKDCKLVAGICMSVAWNVFESVLELERPINLYLFNRTLAQSLTELVKKDIDLFEHHFDMEHVLKSSTIREFDDRFTAKMFGYSSWEEYYQEACIHEKVHAIEVPVLCLNASDDPFSPSHAIPVKDANNHDNVALVVTSHGGHIGFLEGIMPRHSTYMYRWFTQFMDSVFKHGKKELP
ncbi:hypothetical protein LOTGIDRAFT_226275 [Lottia gigantea]|uniref:Phospholipase ABHD3 n=1 Tax=Lottia gigantea TaxID=225164 RepID=V4CBD2_LOTGI|nr:hypothetical protein LOTGIDRAFT_226275 [Lottia gigantea]ESO99164.1 hypothetical protein LOTGIDRAFT_226275 [Lottia gigantea]